MLRDFLAVAVPLWIERLRGTDFSYRSERAHEAAQIIAEKGDIILHRGKKGESAAAFNRLAESVAILAFQPGGITFLGDHWEERELSKADPV